MSDARAFSEHARRVDGCLRLLRRALLPFAEGIEAAASARSQDVQFVVVGGAPREFAALRDAMADAEPWPLELLGPVPVDWTPPDATRDEPKRTRMAWFTRGHHPVETFLLFAKSQARRDGITLLRRPGLASTQCFHTWFVQLPYGTWSPVDRAGDEARVPVTVWVPAEDRDREGGAVPSRGPEGATT